jgi:N-acyl amino acid synthase of PEP-CTERM/exosortase system
MFDDNFEVFLADTEESKEIHYSIRYRVYCEEMGFENKEDFPLEQEYDDYDDHSAHFIVRHKSTGDWIGAMRLIIHNGQALPIEQHCELTEQVIPSRSVEISRLCVVKEMRKGFKDIDPPNGIAASDIESSPTKVSHLVDNQKRINRTVIWGLLNAGVIYCNQNKIPDWYFITTNALAKVLNKGGFKMTSIGEPCNHNGERHPFKKDAIEAYKNETWRKSFRNNYFAYSIFENLALKKHVA